MSVRLVIPTTKPIGTHPTLPETPLPEQYPPSRFVPIIPLSSYPGGASVASFSNEVRALRHELGVQSHELRALKQHLREQREQVQALHNQVSRVISISSHVTAILNEHIELMPNHFLDSHRYNVSDPFKDSHILQKEVNQLADRSHIRHSSSSMLGTAHAVKRKLRDVPDLIEPKGGVSMVHRQKAIKKSPIIVDK